MPSTTPRPARTPISATSASIRTGRAGRRRNVRRRSKHRVTERHLLGRLRAERSHSAGLRRGEAPLRICLPATAPRSIRTQCGGRDTRCAPRCPPGGPTGAAARAEHRATAAIATLQGTGGAPCVLTGACSSYPNLVVGGTTGWDGPSGSHALRSWMQAAHYTSNPGCYGYLNLPR